MLDAEPVALGDLILTEVLQGFRNDTEFRKAQTFLPELPIYELGGYEVCLQANGAYLGCKMLVYSYLRFLTPGVLVKMICSVKERIWARVLSSFF